MVSDIRWLRERPVSLTLAHDFFTRRCVRAVSLVAVTLSAASGCAKPVDNPEQAPIYAAVLQWSAHRLSSYRPVYLRTRLIVMDSNGLMHPWDRRRAYGREPDPLLTRLADHYAYYTPCSEAGAICSAERGAAVVALSPISESAPDTMALDYMEVTPGIGDGGSTGMIRLKMKVARTAGRWVVVDAALREAEN